MGGHYHQVTVDGVVITVDVQYTSRTVIVMEVGKGRVLVILCTLRGMGLRMSLKYKDLL